MAAYISLLRGINVAGKNKIKMGELKKIYQSLGCINVKTYIQSGNVFFESQSKKEELINRIEEKIKNTFSFGITVQIRTLRELFLIIKNNPFAKKDTSNLHITFLSKKSAASAVNEIDKAKGKKEEIAMVQKEIYLFCPNGYGRTKLSNSFFEKKLKVKATTRNWKTVNKLLKLAENKECEQNVHN
ncbi:MAG: DUF1697 domain-containing protein [Bacteroidota bacterium]